MSIFLSMPWIKITGFGGSHVMMPAAAVIVAWLAIGRAWRMAFWWIVLFSIGIVLVVATKIAFIGWGIGIRSLDFTGFSGHAMRAAAVLPVMLYLMLPRARRATQLAGVLLGLMLAILIAVSRVVLHAHSISEALTGCLLGTSISLGFITLAAPLPRPALHPALILCSLLALFSASYTHPAPTQLWLQRLALYLSGHDKPYVRAVWRQASLDPSDSETP